jgi:hypothetical protein
MAIDASSIESARKSSRCLLEREQEPLGEESIERLCVMKIDLTVLRTHQCVGEL